MAKKTTSYAPNLGLIGGEAAVAASLSDPGANVKAFTDAFSGALAIGVLENKKRDAKLNKYIDSIGSVANVSKISDAANKQQITDFVRNQRDKADEIGRHLLQNPDDREAKDKLNAIKMSLSTLNTQLEAFTTEQKDYLKIADDGGLADVTTYNSEYYDNAFTNNGTFNIDENGNIGHTINGKNYLYKDETGKYNVKNQLSIDYLGNAYNAQEDLGIAGEDFNRDRVRRGIMKHFNSKEIGTEGIQVMATQDLTEDDTYELADGTVAGNMSFRQMWAEGHLGEEFYAGFEKDEATGKYNTDWMMDDTNKDQLVKLMSEYYTDVMEDGHGSGGKTYKKKEAKKAAADIAANRTLANSAAIYSGDNKSISFTSGNTPGGLSLDVGDTFISAKDASVFFGGRFDNEYKMTSNGILMKEYDGKWVESNYQNDSKNLDHREKYNKVVKALKASSKPGAYKDFAMAPGATNREFAVQEHGEMIFNFHETFKELDINVAEFGREDGAQSIAKKLNKKYNALGFKFWTSGDNLKVTYKGKDEKSVETDNKTWYYGEHEGEDKDSYWAIINYMKERVKSDKDFWDTQSDESNITGEGGSNFG